MIKIIKADTYFKKLKGLMGKKNINYGMYFDNVNSIHTFFMKESIDVIGLDENNTIVEIHKSVKPNSVLLLTKSINTLEVPNTYSDIYSIGDTIKID